MPRTYLSLVIIFDVLIDIELIFNVGEGEGLRQHIERIHLNDELWTSLEMEFNIKRYFQGACNSLLKAMAHD